MFTSGKSQEDVRLGGQYQWEKQDGGVKKMNM